MIDEYLQALRAALAGADPALVQDALYDAEEYLRAEMTACEGSEDGEESCFAAAVERYGTPGEVAAAYLETEITVARALSAPAAPHRSNAFARFFGIVADARGYGALFYLVLSLLTGSLYFSLVAAMLPAGIGMLPVGVGAIVLLLFFAIIRALSLAEGRIVEVLLGVRMPRRPRGVLPQGDVFERVKHWLTDRRTWTSILYMVLQLPLGVIYFTTVVAALSISAAGVAYPIVQHVVDYPLIQIDGWGYMLQPWATPLVVALGLIGFVLTLHLCRGIGVLHAAYAKALLVGRYDDTNS
ncbi:MAG: sensor domain-containing protein [Coriobacteriia bacterium]|nr:sensor domain-containing protein [Coriobacteriia bacterium]